MTREEAIAKINKCLALSKSANEHEAALALKMAQKMMAQFDLDHADINLDAKMSEAGVKSDYSYTKFKVYEGKTISLVEFSFGVKILWRPGDSRTRTTATVRIFGKGAALKVAEFAYVVIIRAVSKARQVFLAEKRKTSPWLTGSTLTAVGDAFAVGWLAAVRDKVTAFGGEYKVEMDEVKKFIGCGQIKTSTAKGSGRILDHDSMRDGLAAGANFNINTPINQGRKVEAIG